MVFREGGMKMWHSGPGEGTPWLAMEDESVLSIWALADFSHLTSPIEYYSSRDKLGTEDEGE